MPYRLAIAHRQEMIIRDLYIKSKYFFKNFIIKFSVFKQQVRKRLYSANQKVLATQLIILKVSADNSVNFLFSLQIKDLRM